jgi:sterol desaturase/sphingolipid hydroxylase (fatty acid hydroxylase superfamily)
MIETESARVYCDYCERNTRHERDVKRPNHILHLLLSVFTVGLWLPIWILLGLSAQKGKWSCSQCGEVPEGQGSNFWIQLALAFVFLFLFTFFALSR